MRYLLLLLFVFCSTTIFGQEPPPAGREFLEFVRQEAEKLRAADAVPANLESWQKQRSELRQQLAQAWGGFPATLCELKPQKLGEIQRDGYRVEKIIFQTLPDVWMTANAYVPDKPGKRPAVLCVHGHWRGAKQDPVVQSRCIGLAKHGFFVLVVDAFGAGERAVGTALGEYHGEMTGATLLPVGRPLSGIQVYENGRAVDYLQTRPEVDPDLIGITGASGGGNQSMYAGAWDERLKAVVPVCSVGTYASYLGAACCMCEVVPGAIRFTEEWGLLGLVAPRGLMVVNATRDAPQFSVANARLSIEKAQKVFDLHGTSEHVRHAIFESPHDYNQEMRETMYGWMNHHLAQQSPAALPEPEIKPEDPEALRCFPGDSRPAEFITIPKFAAREARRLVELQSSQIPADADAWRGYAETKKRILLEQVFGGEPPKAPLAPMPLPKSDESSKSTETVFKFAPEPGIHLSVHRSVVSVQNANSPLAIVLDLEGAAKAASNPITAELQGAGWSVVTLDLRATGSLAWPSDKIGRAPDHTTSEWAMWIGRPLIGQWVVDVRRTLDAIAAIDQKSLGQVAVVGQGPAGLVAIAAAAFDDRIHQVVAVDTLASYITDVPYEGQRLGTIAPGILRDFGDVAQLVSLVAPRRMVIAGGVRGDGSALAADELVRHYEPVARAWKLLGGQQQLRFVAANAPAEITAALK